MARLLKGLFGPTLIGPALEGPALEGPGRPVLTALVMSNNPSRICLTSDCWTAYTSEGYICLTAHFVDENWKLNSKILSFCKMEPPHSKVELAKKVFDCLKDWRIDKKNILSYFRQCFS